jgi:hypothetical protein
MLENLQNAMNAKKVTTRALALLIGTTEKTAKNKIDGITDFTFDEAVAIIENLFPEYDMRYLFAKKAA